MSATTTDGERFCITNDLDRLSPGDRPRRCLEKQKDDETGRWVPKHYADCADPDTCRGCVPREASHGHLCRACYAKTRDALERVEWLALHLRSIERGAQAIGERVDTSATNRLILPESWIACDSLLDALGSTPMPANLDILNPTDYYRMRAHIAGALGEWGDVDAVVETREGAKRAVVLVKRMQTALARYPDSEVDWRPVPEILCPSCHQATLHRRGPLEAGDELLIQCAGSNLMYEQGIGYDTCEFALDWFEWLDLYAGPIEAAFRLHRKA